jgi:hypothetical protein
VFRGAPSRGFYAADTENDLFDLIDPETNPEDYEYAVIPEGYGIEFRKGPWPVKFRIGTKALNKALGKADSVYLTEEVFYALADGKDLTWHRLYED